MKRYKNISGRSGVQAYELGRGYIVVRFKDGAVYRYTDASATPSSIEVMKELAVRGEGLNGFINRYVKGDYEERVE